MIWVNDMWQHDTVWTETPRHSCVCHILYLSLTDDVLRSVPWCAQDLTALTSYKVFVNNNTEHLYHVKNWWKKLVICSCSAHMLKNYWYIVRSGTDLISQLRILFLLIYALRLRRFKSIGMKFWQDHKIVLQSIDGVGFSIWRHSCNMAAMTSFHVEMCRGCCHLVSEHETSAGASYSSVPSVPDLYLFIVSLIWFLLQISLTNVPEDILTSLWRIKGV